MKPATTTCKKQRRITSLAASATCTLRLVHGATGTAADQTRQPSLPRRSSSSQRDLHHAVPATSLRAPPVRANARRLRAPGARSAASTHGPCDTDQRPGSRRSPTNCTTPGTDALRLTYHANHGLPTGSTLGTLSEALTYSNLGELATQIGKVGPTTVFEQTYNSTSFPRDALGRIKRKVENLNGTTSTWDYTYDLAGRLETVQLNSAPFETYTYDPNGNRLTVEKPSGTTSATYDDQDRLLTYGPWTYTYTPNGELSTKTGNGQTWAYSYDVFGNLKRVDLPNGDVVEYLVDGQNRRVGKKRNGALVKQWLYRDQLHPSAELDGAGNLVARFVWASGKNTPDLVVTGGVTYRVFTDQLGSPRMLVNASTGAVAGVMRHDAWGVVLEDTVSTLMPFGFAGGLYDAETGLVRFGARDYDASVGRWTSKDPIGFRGDGPNLYVYVLNDPVHFIDPVGAAGAPPIPLPVLAPLGPILVVGVLAGAAACALTPGCLDYFLKKDKDDDCPRDVPRRPPNKGWCLDAALQGPAGWGAFCDSFKNASMRARCYSKMHESDQNKTNWCNNYF